jgi:hypothetical protein
MQDYLDKGKACGLPVTRLEQLTSALVARHEI